MFGRMVLMGFIVLCIATRASCAEQRRSVFRPKRPKRHRSQSLEQKKFSAYLKSTRKEVVKSSQNGCFCLNYWYKKTQNIPPIFPRVSEKYRSSAIGLQTFLLLEAVANKRNNIKSQSQTF